MSQELEGKVAIVTGAADGIGRLHALTLASLGARVVVNDVGTTLEGEGRDSSKAQAVVDEIEKAGGSAVVNTGDVSNWEDAQALIQTALDSFGDLHILLNNAGIMRDATLFTISEDDFDDVVRVHLKGHVAPSKFACNYWREKSKREGGPIYGRLVSTASEAWLYGSPGQPNYAAAKAGITSVTMGIAQLMIKYGVTANVVMPRARTRMTMSGPTAAVFEKPDEGFDTFSPDHVLPLFAYLCSPESERISGHLFIVWGKEIKALGYPQPLEVFQTENGWTLGEVYEKLAPFFEKLEPVKDGFTTPAF